MLTGNVGFLGAGAIAEALIRGMLNAGVVQPEQVLVSNRSDRERLADLNRRYGVRTAGSKGYVVDVCQVVVLACKPKDVAGLLAEVGGRFRPGQIVLSLAAGIATSFIEERVNDGVMVVRAMPNTSCQVGESATAVCAGRAATPEAMRLVTEMLASVGQVYTVPEEQMDAVTGLSGSGPAYVYYIVEAMIEAGEAVGLAPEVARALTLQTLKGAALTLATTGADPAVLREQVTSPGGTTAAGLQVLREAGFAQALISAIVRATERSRELGRMPAQAATEVGD
ncbi:pyrroline-5-carboxylate reductase [Symbiobacterium thermophilum]|uniref:Pyrroline-5-carboxylate reductase n=1 Tax=Symbiobacterium thermophilum TaxID=2734 RepID=A0A953I3S7_SYMTR|nr:pyrroline-5-carboxylate reductase [Symbiobacterium thermophilum]MBY6277005.1 pyrroline-5-carboxylate reductase [Symbiobacterium thermophilum]